MRTIQTRSPPARCAGGGSGFISALESLLNVPRNHLAARLRAEHCRVSDRRVSSTLDSAVAAIEAFRDTCTAAPAPAAPRPRHVDGAAPRGSMLHPEALPEVLSEALSPGIRAVALINRSGMQLGSAGEARSIAAMSAIATSLWQQHERSEGTGTLGCLIIECEEGRLVIKAVGGFILTLCADNAVGFGLLKAKAEALHRFLLPPLSQLCTA